MRVDRFQAIKNRLKAYRNLLIVGFAIFLTISLIRNIGGTQGSLERIEKKEREVNKLEEKNRQLKETLEKVQNEAFIEKQIRDQLGLAREGEIVLVLPEDEVLRKLVPKLPEEEEELPDPIWRKWVKLFF
ncbi:septum formation initiator family protein [Candidatus Woesebacteria bacterium]|nr:septum formation initiator family protein [Candidatus Woesebacteria bacterium]